MSWLSRLLGRAPKIPLEQVGSVLGSILESARDLAEYRAAIMKAAARGDLDGPFHTWTAANRRARDFIDNG